MSARSKPTHPKPRISSTVLCPTNPFTVFPKTGEYSKYEINTVMEALGPGVTEEQWTASLGHRATTPEQEFLAKSYMDGFGGLEGALSTIRWQNEILAQPTWSLACPPPGVQCRSFEFDNIKIFYHAVQENYFAHHGLGTIAFYLARPGDYPEHCMSDWHLQGISVEAMGLTGGWGPCNFLAVPSGTHVRITYQFEGITRVREVVFPSNVPFTVSPIQDTGMPMPQFSTLPPL